MRDATIIESKKNLFKGADKNTRKGLFPEIYDISDLITDHSLPLIKFLDIEDSLHTQQKLLQIKLQLPILESDIDIFLFVNKTKRDMYYQISTDTCSFNNICLDEGRNLIGVFYKIGVRKSTSIFLNVYYELKV